jgi:SAM-dependent methyltransferase
MVTEAEVARHYTHGRLETAILEAMRASGANPEALTAADLAPVDEFHLGWYAATVELAVDAGLGPGVDVVDLGSGIGGPARYFAEAHGCNVFGIDLTDEFVAVANDLTARCALDHKAVFVQGSALEIPFPSERFDVATLMHVGMNIEDKAKLFAETRRVLKPSGTFVVYDVMRMDDSPLPYPLPWAETEATSFVETPDTYRRLLEAAGFGIARERNRRDLALEQGRTMREYTAQHGVPPLGLHILMGPAAAPRLLNMMTILERGNIAPIEMVARVRG